MKNLILLLLLTTFLQITSIAQSKVSDKDLVMDQLSKLKTLIEQPNVSGFNAVFHKKLTYGHSNAVIENKAECIEAFMNGAKYSKVEFNDFTIEIINNTAVVRHVLKTDLTEKDKPTRNLHLKVLNVFIKDKKEWKLLSRQAVKIQ